MSLSSKLSAFSDDLVKPLPEQFPALHDSESLRLGHSFPSPSCGVITSLVLSLVPLPQERLQLPQGCQSDTTQLTAKYDIEEEQEEEEEEEQRQEVAVGRLSMELEIPAW